MKKIMLSALSALMLLTFAAPVHAQGNPSTSVEPDVSVDGHQAEVVETTNDSIKNAVNSVVTGQKDINDLLVDDVDTKGMKIFTEVKTMKVDGLTDEKVEFTMTYPNLSADQEVYVLYTNNPSADYWNLVKASVTAVRSAQIKFTMPANASFVIVTKNKTVTPVTPNTSNNDKPVSKPASGYDDGGPFTTDACGNVFDRWGNEVYHAPVCVNNNAAAGNDYTFVNTSDR